MQLIRLGAHWNDDRVHIVHPRCPHPVGPGNTEWLVPLCYPSGNAPRGFTAHDATAPTCTDCLSLYEEA